jgi:hypothetical protein
MTVLGVVVVEEGLAECSGVLDRSEPIRELRLILERLELSLGVRIVIRDIRSGMGPSAASQKLHMK